MLALIASAALAMHLSFDPADEKAATAWIAKAGHRVSPETLTDEDLAPLVQRLGGAKLIGIGEVTHGTRQDQTFKVELIKALVRAGVVDTVLIECNRAAGEGFDHYVRDGAGDPVALLQSPSFFATWRDNSFADLFLWLRAWNQTAAKPVGIAGIDDQDAIVDARRALGFIDRVDPVKAATLRDGLKPLLATPAGRPFADWPRQADAAAYSSVQASAAALRTWFETASGRWRSDPDFGEAAYAADLVQQALAIFELEYKGADASKLTPDYYSRRDRYMVANVMRRLGGSRGVLWAHDEHIASSYDPASDRAGNKPLGQYLEVRLGQGYRTVGFAYSTAHVRLVVKPDDTPDLPGDERVSTVITLANNAPGTLGHVFDPLPADGWWIDMRQRPRSPELDRWGARDIWRGSVGWSVDPATWQADPTKAPVTPPDLGFDVVVWFRTMGPSEMLSN